MLIVVTAFKKCNFKINATSVKQISQKNATATTLLFLYRKFIEFVKLDWKMI